jgi:hypothetical protein
MQVGLCVFPIPSFGLPTFSFPPAIPIPFLDWTLPLPDFTCPLND